MLETFSAMDVMLKIYWIAAIIASVFFIIQAIGTFVGFDNDVDFSGGDADFDADGFSLISIKSITCLILGYGWTGVLFYDKISSPMLLGLAAVGVGLIFMMLIVFMMRQVMKLSKDNTFHTQMVVGEMADVYLHIPANKADCGKITVSVHGSMHELNAMTLSADDIPTGCKVRITEAIDEDTVMVEIV